MKGFYNRFHPDSVRGQQVLPPAPDCPGGTLYVVRPGDTMFRIANQFQISLQLLIIANPQVTNPNILYVGQELCIPGQVTPPPPAPFCPDGTLYIVQRGDTLFSIARANGLTVQEIIAANPQISNPNLITPGQQICIPGGVTPLPEGITRVELEPTYAGVFGGTAFLNWEEPTLWIAAFGLPAPAEIDAAFCQYRAWLLNPGAETCPSIALTPSGEPNIEVGYGLLKEPIAGTDQLIVTAEPYGEMPRPTGQKVLAGRVSD